jgi:hypothetical protein
VFAIGVVDFRFIDVVLAAMARGDWSAFERRLAEGLAGVAHARARRSGPTAEALEAAGTAFRYDRDLISAADMNDWLARSRLSLDDWSNYLARDLLRHALCGSIDDVLDGHPPSAGELIDAAFAEGVCSGSFDAMADGLAGRAALAGDRVALAGDRVALAASSPEALLPFAAAATELVHTNAHWLSIRPAGDTVALARRVLAIEAAYDAAVTRLVSEASLPEIVDRHRMEWRIIDTDTVVFPTEHAAREAMLCITDEQLSLQHVASLSRRTADRRSRFADTIDPADRLLSADLGTLVGPEAVAGGFAVTCLVGRTVPSLADPRIAERARLTAVDAAVRDAVRERVTGRAES